MNKPDQDMALDAMIETLTRWRSAGIPHRCLCHLWETDPSGVITARDVQSGLTFGDVLILFVRLYSTIVDLPPGKKFTDEMHRALDWLDERNFENNAQLSAVQGTPKVVA